MIRYSPWDLVDFVTLKHPLIGLGGAVYGYCYFYKWPIQDAEANRTQRWRDNWRAEVHYQEAIDWDTKKSRDDMHKFIEGQKEKYGSLKKAIAAYEKRTGKTAPAFLLNDPVYDHTLKRVGVPIKGDEEPHFLWDGTAYMKQSERPPTFADGKVRVPEHPRFYLQ
eukprot:CAMPEP_0202695826 /NCGR_PEP_ID=MMETSP1385-20130828/9304_1 /ASSEMBLY_ACC=CAM_ASM_000861 /TAXON_ID=933848 /ORGANISM="Elphidium margaritaceum" /LENGTH=164 /DNA_ID=CAMNT_0049351903 /DNA_START=92 /DNA_END=586 /DNA_ORIENTATION=+